MSLALSDDDARRAMVRLLFERLLGREPATGAEQAGWADYMATHGLDLTIAGIYDSDEAANYRKAHP